MPDMTPSLVLAVALGAAIGGVLRLLLTNVVVARYGTAYAFYATLFVNVSGSFAIGVIIELARTRSGLDVLWRYFLTTGVLGGYTTFSAFSFEALGLFSAASVVSALGYILASVGLGVTGAAAGMTAARALTP